ncbi:hypothetical protein [Streptomyces sp. NEAU-L66]|uniref:hypothetical protein n=1 Tax=Streptomyces sp. NEAU-L66 TaxID=3390812 RepID=UPI0039C6C5C5
MWQAEFQPSGIPAADAEGVVAGVFDSGLHNLASLIAKETAPATASSWTGYAAPASADLHRPPLTGDSFATGTY